MLSKKFICLYRKGEEKLKRKRGREKKKEKMLIIDILLRQLFEHISATSGF